MSGRKRMVKLGWRELWPVWVVFGVLIALGIVDADDVPHAYLSLIHI